jgi:GntR family transcriptional regulator, transcriptional repressor for pyruvate dehydrogenase complex
VTKSQAVDGRGFLPIRTTGGSLRSLKTSESVARDIVDDIVVRRLREGDNLPPETAMLQQYGVSRETLREGLRLLEAQGLISIRRGPGGGPIVAAIDPANLGRV